MANDDREIAERRMREIEIQVREIEKKIEDARYKGIYEKYLKRVWGMESPYGNLKRLQ